MNATPYDFLLMMQNLLLMLKTFEVGIYYILETRERTCERPFSPAWASLEPVRCGYVTAMVTALHPAFSRQSHAKTWDLCLETSSVFTLKVHLLDLRLRFVHEHLVVSTLILQLECRHCILLFRAAAFISPSPLSSSWWHPEFSQHSWWSPICSHPAIWPCIRFLLRGNSHLHAPSSHGRCTASGF